jgi:L-iditol 2-dehydrogenase
LIEPLSVSLHAFKKGNLQPGHTVAIFGAGAIGLMLLLLIRLSEAGEVFIVDVQDFRLKKAKVFGASYIMNNSEEEAVPRIMEKTSHFGVDRAFEAVGLESTLVQALKVLKKGGSSIVVGIFEEQEVKIPVNLFIQKEISLIGSQGYCWDFQSALKLLEKGDIHLEEMITHVVPLSSLQKGFELLMDPKSEAIKVVIKVD